MTPEHATRLLNSLLPLVDLRFHRPYPQAEIVVEWKPGADQVLATALRQSSEEGERRGREEAAKVADREIDRYQDIVGWQPGESRNALIAEIRDKAVAAIRSLNSPTPTETK